MTNEPSWDDIFAQRPTPPAQEAAPAAEPPLPSRRELREREATKPSTFATVTGSDGRPPRGRRRFGWLVALILVIVVLGGGGFAAWTLFEPQIRAVLGIEAPYDYTGSGTDQTVDVIIKQGDTGTVIAQTLADDGVTMTHKAFYQLLLSTTPTPTFQPGTYQLHTEMSAASALAALQDPASRVTARVLIKEGQTLSQVLQTLADDTGTPLADLQAASTDLEALGIPTSEPSAEGWLFPATYSFDPGTTAASMLGSMAHTMIQHLDAAGVAEKDRHDVLTLASVIQKEGGSTDDFYKVSRVFHNRLDQGMLLQSDATVSYGAGSSTIATTSAQRADASNLYNTYVHPGLPVGPISAPGDDAIDAALHPADGTWLYFVLVNGETGETVFSNTIAEHNAAVKQWQTWLAAHPGFGQ